MQVTVEIPEILAARYAAAGTDPVRATLEALALEGYRAHQLSDSQLRRMLGYETRLEVHSFLKDHGIALNYTVEELERDRQTSGTTLAEKALRAEDSALR